MSSSIQPIHSQGKANWTSSCAALRVKPGLSPTPQVKQQHPQKRWPSLSKTFLALCQAPGAPPSCSNICGANPVSIIGMNNCRVECPHPAFFHRALCITSKCFKPRAQKLYTNFRLLIKGMLKNGRTRGFITCIYAAAERCVWCSFQLQWNHIKSTFSSDTWWWNGLR